MSEANSEKYKPIEKKNLSKLTRRSLLLLLILMVLFTVGLFFRNAGKILIFKNNLTKSDAILILMGSLPERVLEASDLYHEGFSDTIMIVKTHQQGFSALNNRFVTLPGESELAKTVLVELGVPEGSIKIIPGLARSTLEEATAINEFLKDQSDIDTVILVTSAEHSLRASKIFRRAFSQLDHSVTIISCPSRYSEFKPDQWWTDKESTEAVIMEYGKLIYGCFGEY